MNNLNANYERILEVLRKISKEQLLTYQRRQPKLSDLELVSLSLTAEFMGIDSENDLFRKLPEALSIKIERSVYNRRRRKLASSLKDIKMQISNCTLIGDRGYLSAEIQLNLFESCNITLNTPRRSNQSNYKKQPFVFRKKRKRIETLFSQLCDQFMIRRNYAKSFEGFKTRILAKITALTTVQYINKFIFNRNINNIKISII
ncbi:MAG: transposase [Flavobacteriaceae bacterium]|nr:transposase [Flavobacteriaceae bacterium]